MQEESVGARRRRGPMAAGDAANPADIEAFKDKAEETREALQRLKRVQCGGFHRPYLILGIDWCQYIDGEEVTGFGN